MKPRVNLPSCSISLSLKRAGAEYVAAQMEAVSTAQPVLQLVSTSPASKKTPFTGLMKNFRSAQIARSLLVTQQKPDIDAYLLLVLADQELTEGREEQARYLVEAAYEVFDRKAEAGFYAWYCCE
jgi:hypothetical protein